MLETFWGTLVTSNATLNASAATSSAIVGATKKFADFLALNPLSSIEETDTRMRILKPWGDPSVVIHLPEDCDGLAQGHT